MRLYLDVGRFVLPTSNFDTFRVRFSLSGQRSYAYVMRAEEGEPGNEARTYLALLSGNLILRSITDNAGVTKS